jgi:alpha-1,6-mannosyltransferase
MKHSLVPRSAALAALGVLLVLLVGAGVLLHAPGELEIESPARMEGFVAIAVVAGAAYLGAVLVVRAGGTLPRRALWGVLAAAAAMRVLTLVTPPMLSSDIFRYVWDGRVQAAGINPYLYIPAAPELRTLRDEGDGPSAIYAHINRAEEAPTIYPPVAQVIFALVARVWPTIWGVKAAMLGFDALAIGVALLLLRAARLPREWVLIYAWNPLPVWEFAGNGHVDAAALGFVALALLAAVRLRPALAGTALGAAVLCKLLPAAIAPALWRRWDWRTPLACIAVIGAGYACYAGAGWRVLGYLPGYASEEGLENGGGPFLLRALSEVTPLPHWAGPAYMAAALAILLGLAAWVALRGTLPADPAARTWLVCRDAGLLAGATMAALSPHYPWYLAWLALPACVAVVPSALWLTVSAVLLYLDPYHERLLWPALVWVPYAALLARELRGHRPFPRSALAAEGD